MSEPVRIITFTPVYKRREILEIMLKGVQRLCAHDPARFDITPFFIVSDPADRDIIDRYGYASIEHPNHPLGKKKNAGLRHVMQVCDFDYLLELGSDDLLTSDYLDFFEPHMRQGVAAANIGTAYFIDIASLKVAYWETQRIIGAGRILSREAIQQIHESGNELWNDDAERGMDTWSWRRLSYCGIHNTLLWVYDTCYILDLKSPDNLNHISNYERSPRSQAEILARFPEAPEIIKLAHQWQAKKQA